MFKKVIGQESGDTPSQSTPSQTPAGAPSPVSSGAPVVPVLKPAAAPAPVVASSPVQAPAAPVTASSASGPAPSQPISPVASASSSLGASASASISSPPGVRNVLSTDVDIKGTVKFQDALIVDGKIDGEIQSTGSLTIGENAWIKAEVKTGTVVVYGKVHGNLTALDKVELKSSAEVVGDIKAKTLTIESGAVFIGKSSVGVAAAGAPESSAS